MLIVSVLRCGKDFTPRHAQWLHRQLGDRRALCLTDAAEIPGVPTAPLLYDWPGWWAKLELFNPDHPQIGHEDLLYIDIDTVITGPLDDFTALKNITMLTDFACEGQENAPPASGIMFIPAREKHRAWQAFKDNAAQIMAEKKAPPFHGDQGFIGQIYPQADRWQTVMPGKIISYKANIATRTMPGFSEKLHDGVANGTLPAGARIVCFHGSPRPWQTALPWVPAFSLANTLKARLKQFKRRLRG
ncbi:hypothetical protein [Shimwellia blattae]|uniref:Uncharacterized protein n=1 Tax=Shimwellia blattae (strain ATCC 29907 / DSM 4481 / JCM 1650 / NBRC 105725 / CDC 9005-74) TaxID=630626 RepID=I2BBK6_SHIBC|nr:hypothetical protein [Shimwellia blattae]AFJ47910.1 hypothetical protein EBL_c28400 [Shimwellia blattae DSM 4481 = NBRC 105725]GAB79520.1 hypothetical protein EB105725_01_00350 [Shimwellia blattae DSM 4481 = NBRC 105725]VDY65411.1 Uncharacterised protein [Shimwellia blattae]VEC24517.1 Uncharacterised protein [Shimwellia blattae]